MAAFHISAMPERLPLGVSALSFAALVELVMSWQRLVRLMHFARVVK